MNASELAQKLRSFVNKYGDAEVLIDVGAILGIDHCDTETDTVEELAFYLVAEEK